VADYTVYVDSLEYTVLQLSDVWWVYPRVYL